MNPFIPQKIVTEEIDTGKECSFVVLDSTKPNIKTCLTCKCEHHTDTDASLIHRRCKLNRKNPTMKMFTVHLPQRPKPDKPVKKLTWTEAIGGFLTGVKDFAENPTLCTKEEYKTRTDICSTCPERNELMNICTVCKCNLAIKSRGKAWKCPLGKWPV